LLTKGVRVAFLRFLSLLGAVLVLAPFAPAIAKPSLSSARERATALSKQIEAQGQALSLAAERYNQAANRRAELAEAVASSRHEAAAAEERWGVLRARLAERVKTLYMHPGAPLSAWLSMRSLNDDARARVLSNSVLTSDASLVEQTDRARIQVRRKTRELAALSADAQRNVEAMTAERSRVASNLTVERALLSQVRGDIAKYIEADRRKELAQAARRADAATTSGTPAITTPISDEPKTEPKEEAPIAPAPAPSSGAAKAVEVARAQIGKPYKWAAAGPDSFDCSGLTMYAWGAAGVQLPHSAEAQYNMFPKVARAELRPGDLVAFGSPIHHIGIYEGGGIMINAPQTGEFVRRDSIDRAGYVGAARP
jgi:cell wall-associated NlpC family hydrolase